MRSRSAASAFLLVVASFLASCTSSPTGAGSGKYAAVELSGFSRVSVQMATEQVFVRNGYKMVLQKNDVLTYEKPGSTGQNIMWGALDKGVWERIQVHITRLGDADNFLVSADAYRVSSHGDSLLEDSKPMGFAMQSKYQDLLEQVHALLAPLPTAPGIGTPEK